MNENYIPLKLTPYAIEKLGQILKPLEERWLKEMHYILGTSWPESPNFPPFQAYYSASVMCLNIVAGISTLFYKPDEYKPGQAGKYFKELLKNFYPWSLDPPQNISSTDAIDVLYDEFRNPLAHALGVRTSGIKLKFILPAAFKLEELNRRLKDSSDHPINGPTITKDEDELEFRVASFYWGIRKMMGVNFLLPAKSFVSLLMQ